MRIYPVSLSFYLWSMHPLLPISNAAAAFMTSSSASLTLSNMCSTTIYSSSDNESDDDIIRMLRGPLGNQGNRTKPKTIVIISDTTGVTAKSAVEKSIQQFNGCDDRFSVTTNEKDEDCEMLRTKVFPFTRTEDEVALIIKIAVEQDAMVVYTFADSNVSEQTARMCNLANLVYVDLLGPMFSAMSSF